MGYCDNIFESFGDWMKRHMNVDLGDFAEIGDVVLTKKQLEPSFGDKDDSDEYPQPTRFKVFANKEQTVFRLVAQGETDPMDSDKAAFPHSASTDKHGKVYMLDKEEYEKLQLFPKQPGMGGGMGGGMPGMGSPFGM